MSEVMSDEALNEAIAIEVMRWTKNPSPDKLNWTDEKGVRYFDREFSTSVPYAWSVVEKMREWGYSFALVDGFTDQMKTSLWQATFGSRENGTTVGVWCATAPRAICLAALQAVRLEAGK